MLSSEVVLILARHAQPVIQQRKPAIMRTLCLL